MAETPFNKCEIAACSTPHSCVTAGKCLGEKYLGGRLYEPYQLAGTGEVVYIRKGDTPPKDATPIAL